MFTVDSQRNGTLNIDLLLADYYYYFFLRIHLCKHYITG